MGMDKGRMYNGRWLRRTSGMPSPKGGYICFYHARQVDPKKFYHFPGGSHEVKLWVIHLTFKAALWTAPGGDHVRNGAKCASLCGIHAQCFILPHGTATLHVNFEPALPPWSMPALTLHEVIQSPI